MTCVRALMAVTLTILIAVPASTQEERAVGNFAGVGVRSMAMGGAFVGVADDFTAVFWNPAGLAQIQQREIYVGLNRNGFENQSSMDGASATANVNNTHFGSLGAVFPWPVARGSFVIAAGINRVSDLDWGLEISGYLDSLHIEDRFRHEGKLTTTTLAAAVDVSPSVSLGLAVNIVSGEDESSNEFISLDTEDHFFERRFVDREEFVDDYERAFTATLGAMVRSERVDPRLRFGLAVTTGATHEISYDFLAPPDTAFSIVEFDDGRVFTAPGVEFSDRYKLSLPLSLAIGGSYRPLPQLLLAAGLHSTEWSQTEYDGSDPAQLRTNADFERQYDDIVRWHLGAEYQLPNMGVDLRVGAYADPIPFVGPRDPERADDPETNPPVVSIQDRRFLTAGAGFFLEETVRCDITMSRGNYEQVEGEGASRLREEATLTRWSLGVSYRF